METRNVPGPGAKSLDVLIKGMDGLQGKVGWFEDSKYEDGTPVAYVATIQEYGSDKNSIPSRSFVRTTITERQKEWAKVAADGSKAVLNGSFTPEQVMMGIGIQAQSDIKMKIENIQTPPLSPITLGLRKYRMGMLPGYPPEPVTGKTVGMIAHLIATGKITTDGVSTKPLIEPAALGGGVLRDTIDVKVE